MANTKDNRVLGRIGARVLSAAETEKISGGFGTLTLCSAPSPAHPKGDGDAGECGWQ